MNQFKSNGESHKQLMEIIVNEIRENRNDIKEVKAILREGAGKISANREAISTIKKWAYGIGIVIIGTVCGWFQFGGK